MEDATKTTTSHKVSKADPRIKAILAKTFPEWKGRKVFLEIRPSASYQMQDYWSEGSRCYARALDLVTMESHAPTPAAHSPYNSIAHAEVTLPGGVAIVEHQIFCGRDAGVTIVISRETALRLRQGARGLMLADASPSAPSFLMLVSGGL